MTEERNPPWEMTNEQAAWASQRQDQREKYADVSSAFFRPANDEEYWREIGRRKHESNTDTNSVVERHREERIEEVRRSRIKRGGLGELTSALTPEQHLALLYLALDGLSGKV